MKTGLSFVLMAMSLGITGCTSGEQSGQTNVYFLQEKPNDFPDMAGLFEGKLALNQDCLQIQGDNGRAEEYNAIWPAGFNFSVEGESVNILDGDAQVVAQVGDQVRVGGGELKGLSREEFEQNYLGDSRCSEPYWSVSRSHLKNA